MPVSASFEHLGRFIAIFNRDDVWIGVSDDLAALLGYERHELIGQPASTIYEPHAPAKAKRVRAMLETTGAVSEVCVLVTKTGERIPYAFTARAVNGGDLFVTVGEPIVDALAPLADDPWLNREETAVYAHTTTRTIDRAVREHRLRAGGTEGLRLFRRSWVDAWLESGGPPPRSSSSSS